MSATDPAAFDVDAFLGEFTASVWKVNVPTRGDLLPRIEELREQIGDSKTEKSVGDDLIREHNDLVRQFDESMIEFAFRPSTNQDWIVGRKHAIDDGVDLEAEGSMEQLYPYLWAITCTSHPGITGQAFLRLRERVGDSALAMLHKTWLAANNGGLLIEAPFSPRPLPTPTTGKRSRS